LWNKEKIFFIFLKRAGFFLRKFAYSDKRGLNKQVVSIWYLVVKGGNRQLTGDKFLYNFVKIVLAKHKLICILQRYD